MLGIDTKTNHIHSVSYFDNKSTKITFKIRTFKPNTPLSGKEFVFDTAKYKAKNYSITEL
jgi:outer membrane lipoprotein-sorting protein